MATQHASLKRLAAPLDKFIVDGFNFCEPSIRHYFLTHAHSDHTTGLHGSFDNGTIYCSSITARILRATLGIKQKVMQTIDPGETIIVESVTVTAIDAGHCPGSLMLLFRDESTGYTALHTGDCRASDSVRAATLCAMQQLPVTTPLPAKGLRGGSTGNCEAAPAGTDASSGHTGTVASVAGSLDALYLDTTYAADRWRFPSQPEALETIDEIVTSELRREPRTLFVIGSYQIGKERAIAAAAKAAGGRALVPNRRALSLRLCNAWDDHLHAEADGDDVRVHVAPLSSMGAEAHAEMAALLAGVEEKTPGRFAAVVTIRPVNRHQHRTSRTPRRPTDAYPKRLTLLRWLPPPGAQTGWTYTRARPLGTAVWAENDGRTRVYGVPYSEHSSFTELMAFVAVLSPRRLVPTVNAETARDRDRLGSLFCPLLDLRRDKRRLEYHFASGTADCTEELLRVDPEQQRALWDQIVRPACRSRAGDGRALASLPTNGPTGSPAGPAGPASEPNTAAATDRAEAAPWGEAESMVEEVLGPGTPAGYISALVADSGGDAEAALAVHFGPNEGVVPVGWAVEGDALAAAGEASTSRPHRAANGDGGEESGGGEARGERRRRPWGSDGGSQGTEEDELALPPGTVAWVLGKEFKLYRSREALQARLASLGAAVIAAGSRLAKQEVTLIVVPEGTEAGSVPRSACPQARVVQESFVVRRAMAMRSGQLPSPQPAAVPAGRSGVKRPKPAASTLGGGEKRAARVRASSAAASARMARALSERLYLVSRRDASTTSGSGLVTLRHEFAVLGSTGNVYDVAVCRMPSCSCVDHVERKQVCKHLLFVYLKVLRVPNDSHIPLQRALLRSELGELLRSVQPSIDTAASDEVRQAYAQIAQDDACATLDAAAAGSAAVDALVPPRDSAAEPCAICFDAIDDESPDEVLASVAPGDVQAAAGDGVPRPAAPAVGAGQAATSPRVVHCALGCGRNYHAACLRRWFQATLSAPQCPVCRAAWHTPPGAPPLFDRAGPRARDDVDVVQDLRADHRDAHFVNLGEWQPGTHHVRDSSSYSPWLAVHERRREHREYIADAGGSLARPQVAGGRGPRPSGGGTRVTPTLPASPWAAAAGAAAAAPRGEVASWSEHSG